MLKARTGPTLVLVGGVLSAVGMIVGWSKITMSYGENRAETVTNTTPMAVFGAGLLLIGGYFLFQRVTARRRFSEVMAAIGGILVLASVVLEFTRNYGVEMIGVEQGPQSAEEIRAQLQELIAAGVAHLDVTWTIGLYITLAGGSLDWSAPYLPYMSGPPLRRCLQLPHSLVLVSRPVLRLVSGEYGSGVDDRTPWEKLGLWWR